MNTGALIYDGFYNLATNFKKALPDWTVYMFGLSRDDVWMADVGVSGEVGAVPRRRRSAAERRRVVEETLEAGASVDKWL